MTEDDIYQKIYEELESGNLVGSTWARSFEQADGDENKSKSKYISLRLKQIKEDLKNSETAHNLKLEEDKVLNHIERLARVDGAILTLSSLKFWYDSKYTGDKNLTDEQLKRVIEISREKDTFKPITPAKYSSSNTDKNTRLSSTSKIISSTNSFGNKKPSDLKLNNNALDRQDHDSKDKEISGIGGWLFFLVISFLLSPFYFLGFFSSEVFVTESLYPEIVNIDAWNTYKTYTEYLIYITFILCFCGAGLLIFNRSSKSISYVKVIIWMLGPVSLIFISLLLPIYFIGKDAVEGSIVISLPFSILLSILWTMYLNKSKRVSNTYKKQTIDQSYDGMTVAKHSEPNYVSNSNAEDESLSESNFVFPIIIVVFVVALLVLFNIF